MATVHLHVGLAKTGTSTIQRSLFAAREELAQSGVLYPGSTPSGQRDAVYDFVGRRIAGDDPSKVAGAWNRLLAEIEAWRGDSVVLSEELLSLVRPKQAKRMVAALGGDVAVIMTLRDIGSVIPSAWQQEIRKGRTFTWPEFLASVRDTESGSATAGVAFWLRHDALRILDLWEQHVPRDRIQIVTVPDRTQPRTLLLDRFAACIGAPEGSLQPVERSNPSVSSAGVEVLRRLNVAMDAKASQRHHLNLLNRVIAPSLIEPSGPPARVPHEYVDALTTYTDRITSEMSARGYRVHGQWVELAPVVADVGAPSAEQVAESDLLAATEIALNCVSREYTRLQRRSARAAEESSDTAGRRERASSSLRAKAFDLRVRALERGDDSAAVRWVARRQTGSPMGEAHDE